MYHFIVNPNARSGLGQLVWDELESTLKTRNISYKVYFTKYQKHATKITEEITSDGKEHIVVALGGDGTVNEVVNGIANYENTILGYIPIGSSNDFARGMKLPTEPAKALQAILNLRRTQKINIGKLVYQNKSRNFAVSSGIGFDAAICHEAVVSKLKLFFNRLKLGKLTYVAIAIHRLFLTTPCGVTITLDDKQTISFPSVYFVALMNNCCEGGGIKFCPKAKIDDDILDLIVVSDIPKMKILLLLPTAFFGFHVHFKGVHIYKCKQVKIQAERSMPLHTDGEPLFLQRELSASLLPEKLRMIRD